MENSAIGRQPQWKKTSMEENINGRLKTTTMGDALNGRIPRWKISAIEDDHNIRQPSKKIN